MMIISNIMSYGCFYYSILIICIYNHQFSLHAPFRRHVSAVPAAPRPLPLRRLGAFVSGVGAPPDAGQLAAYIQRLRGYGFDASPIIRKFLACGAALTEDLVRICTEPRT